MRENEKMTSVNSEAFGLLSKTWAITWLGLSVLEAMEPTVNFEREDSVSASALIGEV